MLRFLSFLTASVIIALVGLFISSGGNWYRTVDRAWMATRYLNQELHYRLGYQLPGTPDLFRLGERLKVAGLKRGDPIFIRIFKSELALELWMKHGEHYVLFASYPICYWSGQLGPKLKVGDHQAPEGFYTVSKGQLNPNSHWFRAFDVGFPNLIRPRARAHRFPSYGSWRMFICWLLCDDEWRDFRGLGSGDGGARCRAGAFRCRYFSVSADRGAARGL